MNLTTAITITALALTVPAQAQQSTFTDQRGNFAGSSVTRGNSTSFTDQRGNFAGSSITRGSRTDFFDAHGKYTGTTTRPQR